MKKILPIALLLFIAVCSKAQTSKPIDGFFGVRFGDSSETVKQTLKAKEAVEDIEFNRKYSKNSGGILKFKDVILGNRTASDFSATFIYDQVAQGEFIFDPETESKSFDYYLSLVKDIKSVYGEGEIERNYNLTGDDVADIKSGKANFSTMWHDGYNLIWVHITADKYSGIHVNLVYRDTSRFNMYQNQQKEKNKSEL